LSFGVNGVPLEQENKPDWIPSLVFPTIANINNNIKWYEDQTCKILAKNHYILIGFKNATDYIHYIKLLGDDVPVQDIMINGHKISNYIPNVVKAKRQRENKRGSFTIR
jgi:hypothetical protein